MARAPREQPSNLTPAWRPAPGSVARPLAWARSPRAAQQRAAKSAPPTGGSARSGWLLVALVALAGGLAAPASAPIADPPSPSVALALANPADARMADSLA